MSARFTNDLRTRKKTEVKKDAKKEEKRRKKRKFGLLPNWRPRTRWWDLAYLSWWSVWTLQVQEPRTLPVQRSNPIIQDNPLHRIRDSGVFLVNWRRNRSRTVKPPQKICTSDVPSRDHTKGSDISQLALASFIIRTRRLRPPESKMQKKNPYTRNPSWWISSVVDGF